MIEGLKEHGSELKVKIAKRDTYVLKEVIEGFAFEY